MHKVEAEERKVEWKSILDWYMDCITIQHWINFFFSKQLTYRTGQLKSSVSGIFKNHNVRKKKYIYVWMYVNRKCVNVSFTLATEIRKRSLDWLNKNSFTGKSIKKDQIFFSYLLLDFEGRKNKHFISRTYASFPFKNYLDKIILIYLEELLLNFFKE